MDSIKLIIAGIISSIIAYLQPVHNAIFVLAGLVVIDLILGIYTDININKTRFNFKKAMFACFYAAIYASIIASTFVIGERMGDKDESLLVVKTLTYVFIFFYISNINKNLKRILPHSRIIAFLDFFVGLKFMERIPELGKFLEYEKKTKNKKI